jgi:CBS domain containing-hemolysin-like protein
MTILIINIAIAILLLSCSAFFSASETALFSIPRERILFYQKEKKYQWLYLLLKNGQRTLLLILLGNLFVNITLAGLIDNILGVLLLDNSTLVSLGIATVLIIVFGEMLPKNIALKNNEAIAVSISPFLYHLEVVATPVLKLIQNVNSFFLNLFKSRLRRPSPFITIEELKTNIEKAATESVINNHEKAMIIGILSQGMEPVRKVMIHRSRLLIVQEQMTVKQVLQKMALSKNSLAVVRSNTDIRTIRGVVHIKDCAGADGTELIATRIISPVVWVAETMETADLISLLFTEKCDEVCVLDQFGCFSGIFSLQLCLNSIMSNMVTAPVKEHVTGVSRIFDGLQEIAFIQDWLPRSLLKAVPNVRTLNGLLTNYLENIPKSGDRVAIDGYNFYIIKASPSKIERVLISKGEKV